MTNDANHSSFIHNLQIASPCTADWNKMSGDARKRFCAECKLHVYNIEEMTIPEAEELIVGSEGNVCVQLYRRADGTVLTSDCPVGLMERMKRRWRAISATACAGIAIGIAWATHREVIPFSLPFMGCEDSLVRGRAVMSDSDHAQRQREYEHDQKLLEERRNELK